LRYFWINVGILLPEYGERRDSDMAVLDTTILRAVERKVDKENLDSAKLDVLVMHGHVTLTGLLVDRITHHVIDGPERERFKKELKHIEGVTEITLHMTDSAGFI
jgi:osmotically-inducible protein OsmY